MLVYGDCRRTEAPSRRITALRQQLQTTPTSGAAEARAWATTLLVETGELVQGLLDFSDLRAEGEPRPHDRVYRQIALAAARVYLLAQAEPEPDARLFHRAVRSVEATLELLARRELPAKVEIRTPEGYAYYAVYPFLYAQAARDLESWGREWIVIGIRSIGASLGAVVAAALGTQHLCFVRPTGPPFRRTQPLDANLEQAILTHDDKANYAVVDEGPGLSGSSFGAVADCLLRHGISSSRIHFFPSHAGDLGPQASDSHRQRWKRAHRCHSAFESHFDEARLRSSIFDGMPGDICDISAGRWRSELYADRESWPPVHPGLERRKYLLREPGRTRIAKFVGLAGYGRTQVERAFRLYQRGFIPEPLGYREGFLVSSWYETAMPLDRASSIERDVLLSRAGDYLAFLGSAFRAAEPGASLDELLHMAVVNTLEGLGRDAADLLSERWSGHLADIASACAPVAIDGRLHRWEWLVLDHSRLVKADALEHHADHGLVGCQDLAWDLAGLRVEHAMTASECDRLVASLATACGYRSHPEKEAFFETCYLAYQMGYYALAADAAASADAMEKARCTVRRDFYANGLAELLLRS
jgi:hypothetical protein